MSLIRDRINHTLETTAPALFACLSPLGRRAFYSADIPVQAQEAKATELNGTIGIFTRRYRAIRPALEALDPELLRPLPFNAGFFVLLEIPERLGLDPHVVRRHLIEQHSTGIVSVSPRYLRLAICSVSAEALPELVRRVETGVRELAAGLLDSRV